MTISQLISALQSLKEKHGDLSCPRHQRVIADPYFKNMPFIFGGAFQYEPSTGDLSTTEEFGSILIGQLDKYLSQTEVQAAIRELGNFLEQQSDR